VFTLYYTTLLIISGFFRIQVRHTALSVDELLAFQCSVCCATYICASLLPYVVLVWTTLCDVRLCVSADVITV